MRRFLMLLVLSSLLAGCACYGEVSESIARSIYPKKFAQRDAQLKKGQP